MTKRAFTLAALIAVVSISAFGQIESISGGGGSSVASDSPKFTTKLTVAKSTATAASLDWFSIASSDTITIVKGATGGLSFSKTAGANNYNNGTYSSFVTGNSSISYKVTDASKAQLVGFTAKGTYGGVSSSATYLKLVAGWDMANGLADAFICSNQAGGGSCNDYINGGGYAFTSSTVFKVEKTPTEYKFYMNDVLKDSSSALVPGLVPLASNAALVILNEVGAGVDTVQVLSDEQQLLDSTHIGLRYDGISQLGGLYEKALDVNVNRLITGAYVNQYVGGTPLDASSTTAATGPSFAIASGFGTSPTLGAPTYGSDLAGTVSVNVGTGGAASNGSVTVTFSTPHGGLGKANNVPCVVTLSGTAWSNTAVARISATTGSAGTGMTSFTVFLNNVSAWSASATATFNYVCVGL